MRPLDIFSTQHMIHLSLCQYVWELVGSFISSRVSDELLESALQALVAYARSAPQCRRERANCQYLAAPFSRKF